VDKRLASDGKDVCFVCILRFAYAEENLSMKRHPADIKADVKKACKKFLTYDYAQTAQQRLLDLAQYVGDEVAMDRAGKGELVEQLEDKLIELLDKEAVVFMPSGRMAQLIALKLWCERRAIPRIAIHPRSHIEELEKKAYQEVYGLKAAWIGECHRCTRLKDLTAISDPIGAIALEIPLRPLGCVLPPWSELQAMSQWARSRNIPFHADAARLWESGPYYGRTYAEIAALFDTLYVSFYKGLGAIAGSALAGPADLIKDARYVQHRMGGRLNKQFPMLIDALRGLDMRLPLMSAFHDKARELAGALAALPGIMVTPNPPHANAMIVALRGDYEKLTSAALQVAERTGLWLFDLPLISPIQGLAMFEITIREAALDVSVQEAVQAVSLLGDLVPAK
jgi:threonine aldolase